MAVYFSSDFHLCHKAITKYRPQFATPAEHDEHILHLISQLTKRDILFVLGDFLFDGPHFESYLHRISQFPCRIKLVMGNHDSKLLYTQSIAPNIELQLPLFSYKSMWVSHCPIHPQEMRSRLGNLHGHLHGDTVQKAYYNIESGCNDAYRQNPRYFNVNLDNNDFQFVPLDTIKSHFKGYT